MISAGARLIDILRQQLGLTGTKEGCRLGECGTCTVLIDRRPHLACMTLAAKVDQEVLTIEGLSDTYLKVKQAFADEGGFQCGFCTPGQIMNAVFLLEAQPEQNEDESWLREQLSGNICRCTGYAGILRAILKLLPQTGRDPQRSDHE
ncbi:carbon-monoxide dehydrogenase small subunit [Beijerinckia sp. 28-YEA-48]|nr:carbon-monoxide dehydrogenase small subunit [Beijerinckia sp. 28-YEA-48]